MRGLGVLRCRRGGLVALALTVVSSGAWAGIDDINGFVVQERRFNDFAGTSLTVENNGLTSLRFFETNFVPDGGSDFANRHVGWLSDDGVNPFAFQNSQSFDFSFDVNLSVGENIPAKEVGVFMDSLIGGEGQMIIKTNGEIAAFGSYFPFFSTNAGAEPPFGGQQYVPGTTINLGLQYRAGSGAPANPGDPVAQAATIQYFVDGVGGEVFALGNTENGVIDGSRFGVYVQYPPDFFAVPADFGDALFTNIVFNPISGVGTLAGDFNGNGLVEQADLDLVLGDWGQGTKDGDWIANFDGLTGSVDQDELDAVLGNWGSSSGPSFEGFAVPEPATAAVLAGGVLLLARSRRGLGRAMA